MEALRTRIADHLTRSRLRTLQLADAVSDVELVEQHSPIMSPLVWDLAHVGNQEELWLVRDVGGREPVRCDIDHLYDAFKHPRKDRPQLPLLNPGEARAYVAQVRDKVFDVLDRARLEGPRLVDQGFAFGMIAQHEQQHDETMLAIIRDRLTQADCANGFILDGFPRTVAQADGLAKLLTEIHAPLDAVVLFELPTELLVKRMSGRRVCSHCNRVFNIHSAPPSVPPACIEGRTEHEVVQRADDAEEVVRERLRVYEEKTRKPVIGFYSYTGLIRTVDAEADVDALLEALEWAREAVDNGFVDERAASA